MPAGPMNNQNIFEPVAAGVVPASIKTRHDHPVQNKHVRCFDRGCHATQY
jgi:endo-1,3(4)-beta-glucanase